MKPTLKLPYKEFLSHAISNLQKSYPGILLTPESITHMKNTSFDGPCEVFELPDYLEIEVDLIPLETGKNLTITPPEKDYDHCAICGCNINDCDFCNNKGTILCKACDLKNK